ncbi:alpha/beta hydrolase [Histidinibacterium lentulum]|uniref:Alpha/beta hydrolase n=1 Tax=Histidinibacterium lentulum TaxID=2480588 RepID=A0A3N2R8H8_9RHOB|nr:alpha/beta hydrolase fold domain-containing protein [Histidinibacterium lentulum]ROU03780.1 alpha/beta hydrolase [Histidinibacterium lentulum]
MSGRPASEAEVRDRIGAVPVTGGPEEMRAAFARLMGPAPELARETLGGCAVARAGDGPVRAVWLHGGGYVFGSPESHGWAALALAERLGGSVLLPDYDLAPEAPWPAQMTGPRAVLEALGPEGAVALVGDSAGGHLAMRLALEDPARVRALALISPNTDRSGQSGTRRRDSDAMNDDATDSRLARMAFGDADPASAEVSPLLADLGGLPKLLILAAGDEILLDDALLLARAAALAGVRTDLRVWPGLFHLFPLWPEALPEAREALDAIAGHLRT